MEKASSSSAAVTKRLRSRDVPLLALLPEARLLFASSSDSHDSDLFFPRRGEWLLEWLVQRLKEDDDRAARTAADSWALLAALLRSVAPAAVAATLKRHAIVSLVAKTMAEIGDAAHADDGDGRVARLLDQMLLGVVRLLLDVGGRGNGAVAAAVRAAPETGAAVLGAFLRVARHRCAHGAPLNPAWLLAAAELWEGSIWGSGHAKKKVRAPGSVVGGGWR